MTPDSISRLAREESGATAIEYGLIAALIALVLIGVLTLLGGNISGVFGSIATTIGSAGSSS